MKKFIITIDTEGDNLWEWQEGMPIFTENVKYLPRFQHLCEEYGFKPVWLSNNEMINDSAYIEFIAEVEERKAGELGMHLHAWNTPPDYDLPIVQSGQPYLIEYPKEIMEEKIAYMTDLIKSRCGICPVSHRAGRWAMNQTYFDLLIKYGYKVDCSYTPGINWSSSLGRSCGSKGSDYSSVGESVQIIKGSENNGSILEVPMTTRTRNVWVSQPGRGLRGIASSAYHMFKGKQMWLRPMNDNFNDIKKLISMEQEAEYLMFMIHSSEFMPGGSPKFKTKESIEELYRVITEIFDIVSKTHEGCTLREYAERYVRTENKNV